MERREFLKNGGLGLVGILYGVGSDAESAEGEGDVFQFSDKEPSDESHMREAVKSFKEEYFPRVVSVIDEDEFSSYLSNKVEKCLSYNQISQWYAFILRDKSNLLKYSEKECTFPADGVFKSQSEMLLKLQEIRSRNKKFRDSVSIGDLYLDCVLGILFNASERHNRYLEDNSAVDGVHEPEKVGELLEEINRGSLPVVKRASILESKIIPSLKEYLEKKIPY